MIERRRQMAEVEGLLRRFPVVAVLGARQVGKTTLARQVAARADGAAFFDLEDPRSQARLREPTLALDSLCGLVVLDEVQARPDLFPVLRVLADRARRPARFLVLGSASPALLRQTSESLAGRIAYHQLGGFDLGEVGVRHQKRLWLRGGFPRSYLARTESESYGWRRQFAKTYTERDLAALGIRTSAATIQRFWTMLAHYHGQIWNAAELARAFGVAEKSVRHYLDVLCETFMVRRLRPWLVNPAKREVKAPKVYLTDSGLLHYLLGVRSEEELLGHPKVGASWEGFALAEVIRHLGAEPEECFAWGLHTGAELDLLVVRGNRRRGFEFKLTDSPTVTRSMRSALEVLELERLDVVHAGQETYPLADRITAVPLVRIDRDLAPLGTPHG